MASAIIVLIATLLGSIESARISSQDAHFMRSVLSQMMEKLSETRHLSDSTIRSGIASLQYDLIEKIVVKDPSYARQLADSLERRNDNSPIPVQREISPAAAIKAENNDVGATLKGASSVKQTQQLDTKETPANSLPRTSKNPWRLPSYLPVGEHIVAGNIAGSPWDSKIEDIKRALVGNWSQNGNEIMINTKTLKIQKDLPEQLKFTIDGVVTATYNSNASKKPFGIFNGVETALPYDESGVASNSIMNYAIVWDDQDKGRRFFIMVEPQNKINSTIPFLWYATLTYQRENGQDVATELHASLGDGTSLFYVRGE